MLCDLCSNLEGIITKKSNQATWIQGPVVQSLLKLILDCAVPENIHTLPTDGFFVLTPHPPTPSEFPFQRVYDDPPTPLEFPGF